MTDPDKSPLAVALTYEAPHAPRVVAVGRGELGQRIIDTAREHGVPLETNAPLAEALSKEYGFRSVKVEGGGLDLAVPGPKSAQDKLYVVVFVS